MKKLKKTALLVYCVVLFQLVFFALPAPATAGLRVVCTFFPLYLFTKNVVGDISGVSVELLLPPDMGCPHDYSLTPGDIKGISRADVLIVNGFGMEEFLTSSELVWEGGVKVVEATKGAEPVLSHGGVGGDIDDNHFNPHLFASPGMATVYVRNIERVLSLSDPAANYKDNARRFISRLEKLARDLGAVAEGVSNKRVMLFHSSLQYLLHDAGLEVIDATRPEKVLSAREVVRLIREVEKSRPAAIFYDSQYSSKLVDMLSSETGVPSYSLDSVAAGPGYVPGYYEAAMRENIDTIKKAISD